MTSKQITEQTAYETDGIPTPPDQENITATDMVSGAVEEVMDNIQETFEVKPDEKKRALRKY